MSANTTLNPANPDVSVPAQGVSAVVVDSSSRLPLLVMFGAGAFWLVISSILGLISSIKFHSPDFLAAPASVGDMARSSRRTGGPEAG